CIAGIVGLRRNLNLTIQQAINAGPLQLTHEQRGVGVIERVEVVVIGLEYLVVPGNDLLPFRLDEESPRVVLIEERYGSEGRRIEHDAVLRRNDLKWRFRCTEQFSRLAVFKD